MNTTAAPAVELKAAERAYQIPMVHDACDKASEIYTQVKAYNQYTEQAAAKVEEIVGYISAYLAANETVQQTVQKYEPSVNQFIVSQIDTLAAKYPIVAQPTEEVIAAAKQASESTMEAIKAKTSFVQAAA